jgi:TolB protein
MIASRHHLRHSVGNLFCAGFLVAAGTLVWAAAAAATFPGHNGRIAFAATGTGGTSDIVTATATGANPTDLTKDQATELAPKYSADGRWIVYQRSPRHKAGASICLMRDDGSHDHCVTKGYDDLVPSFSPDGKRIVFARYDPAGPSVTLRIVDRSGAHDHSTGVSGIYPDWSPNGKWIAYAGDAPGNPSVTNIWKVHPSGLGSVDLKPVVDVSDEMPSWSPSGRRLVFSRQLYGSTTSLVEMSASGHHIRTLVPTGTNQFPAFSPNGRDLVYTALANGGNVLTRRVNGDGMPQEIGPGFAPSWQPR